MAQNKIAMHGRFALYFDYDTNAIYFSTIWDDCHSQKRTVTQEQADVIKDIMMGGHIKVSSE